MGARRRSPRPRSGALPSNQASPSARAAQALPLRFALAPPAQDRPLLQDYAALRAAAGRPVGGTSAVRPAVDRPDSLPRERLDGAGGRAWRDLRASSGLLEPSDECDGPGRTVIRSPGSGSLGLGAGERAAVRADRKSVV